MQFSTALIALVAASLANAQLPDVPSCSLNCFVSALTTDGCSSLTDFACHCQKPALVSDITPCVKKACDVADQISVSNAVVSQCSSAGHPIVVPPVETTTAAGTTSSSTSSAPSETSATATATGSGSTSTGESSSASATGSSSGSASGSGSASMTATSSSPAGSSSAGSGSGSGSTPAGTSTPMASKTGSGSGATTSPAFNAAVGIKGNMAGVAAIAAAAAYVL